MGGGLNDEDGMTEVRGRGTPAVGGIRACESRWPSRPPLPSTTDGPSLPTPRYNDFLHDPLSLCKSCRPQPNGENAISARSDLNPANGSYPFQALSQRSHGGIDVKVLPRPGACGWAWSASSRMAGC